MNRFKSGDPEDESNKGGNTGTVIPNGPLIKTLRQAKGWTRADLVEHSELVVEEIAETGDKNGTIAIWYWKRIERGWSHGLTIARVGKLENSQPVLPIALQILSGTVGVTVQELIKSPADEPPPSSVSNQPGYNAAHCTAQSDACSDTDHCVTPSEERLVEELSQVGRDLIMVARELIRKLPPP